MTFVGRSEDLDERSVFSELFGTTNRRDGSSLLDLRIFITRVYGKYQHPPRARVGRSFGSNRCDRLLAELAGPHCRRRAPRGRRARPRARRPPPAAMIHNRAGKFLGTGPKDGPGVARGSGPPERSPGACPRPRARARARSRAAPPRRSRVSPRTRPRRTAASSRTSSRARPAHPPPRVVARIPAVVATPERDRLGRRPPGAPRPRRAARRRRRSPPRRTTPTPTAAGGARAASRSSAGDTPAPPSRRAPSSAKASPRPRRSDR